MGAARKIGVMTAIKVFAALLGLLYSILQVNYFGTTKDIESFFVAASLMYLVLSLTQAGQLSEIFLPLYHKIKTEKGLNAAHTVFSIVVNSVALYLIVGLLIIFGLKDVLVHLIAPGFSLDQKQFTALLFIALLPLIFLQITTSFIITWFNAEEKFGRVELLGGLNTLVSVGLLIVFHEQWGVWVLVASLVVGKVVETIVYFVLMYRYGYKHKWVLTVDFFDKIHFFKNLLSTFGYVVSTQFYTIAITSSATLLPQGTYAVFSYAQQLYVKSTGFLIQPIQTFFFSRYSGNVSNNSSQDILVSKAIRVYFAIYVLVLALIYWGGTDVFMLIWRKNTNPEVFLLGAGYLIANFATLIFSSIGGLYRKIAISHGLVKTLYISWTVCQIVSAGSIYWLTQAFGSIGLTFAILLNLGLLNTMSVLVVIGKVNNRTMVLKPIAMKYSLLFIVLFPLAGAVYSWLSNIFWPVYVTGYGLLVLKLSSFSFIVLLVYLCLLIVFKEFDLLRVKRNH